jgi:hypothetical protein
MPSVAKPKLKVWKHFINAIDTELALRKNIKRKYLKKFVQIEIERSTHGNSSRIVHSSKKLILFHSKIELRSPEGAGTTFSFTIDSARCLKKKAIIKQH